MMEIEQKKINPKIAILPHMKYPENGPLNSILRDYEPMKLFLNSKKFKLPCLLRRTVYRREAATEIYLEKKREAIKKPPYMNNCFPFLPVLPAFQYLFVSAGTARTHS